VRLRHAAPIIMTRELSEIALRHAVREKVFSEAQASVLKAVELFWKFVEKHQWKGNSLSASAYRLPNGLSVKIDPIGKYFSQRTKSEWLVALQPRQGDIPNDEQFCMWRSALVYEFCAGKDAAMIVDLSKNPVSQKRELREVLQENFHCWLKVSWMNGSNWSAVAIGRQLISFLNVHVALREMMASLTLAFSCSNWQEHLENRLASLFGDPVMPGTNFGESCRSSQMSGPWPTLR
jgi:hypothetical protein